jgi:plastocyanin
MTRVVVMACMVVLVCMLSGCTDNQEVLSAQKVPGADVTVAIQDSPESVGIYVPATAHIKAGQTVGWINASGDYHTVTFDLPGSPPSSGGFGHGSTFKATFPKQGTYRYHCLYHYGMTGQVVVAAS